MSKIIQKILKFFEGRPYNDLEAYITSKRPTNCAEVEHWARMYTHHHQVFWKGLQ